MENNFSPHEIVWTYEKASRIWDYYASNKTYASIFFSNQVGDSVIDSLLPYHNLSGNILDYGCGQGFLIEKLLRRGVACEGLDFSRDSVKTAEQKFAGQRNFKGVTLVQSIPTQFESNKFDVVFLVETIEHILAEDLSKTLAEIYRITRRGGYVLVTTPNRENLEVSKTICPQCGCIFHRMQHVSSWTKESLSEIMQADGFTKVLCKETHFKEQGKLSLLLHFMKTVAHKLLNTPYPHLMYIGRK
jgi:2-polyprenyl-3-methyl-5-hydroxy-6-metoxy-1,4-benzoquinol methylase